MMNIALFPRHGKAACSFLWASVFLPAVVLSQSLYIAGARAAGLAGCSTSLPNHTWAGVTNWSGCASVNDVSVSFAAVPAPFGLSELRAGAVSIVVPFSGGGTGLLAERMGGDLYRRIVLASGVGIGVGEGMAIGCGLSWHHESYERYGAASSVSVDAGCSMLIADGVFAGSSCTALATLAGDPDVAPARSTRLGISWEPNVHIRLSAEAQKELRHSLSLCAGIEYAIIDRLVVRGGLGDEPSRSAFGCTASVGPIRVSYAAAIHTELGWSHAIEVEIAWGKTE